MRYGRWWALQWGWHLVFSLGVHFDWRARVNRRAGVRYGPYLDIHLPGLVASVGVNPIYAGEPDLVASYSRGGIG